MESMPQDEREKRTIGTLFAMVAALQTLDQAQTDADDEVILLEEGCHTEFVMHITEARRRIALAVNSLPRFQKGG